MTDIKYHLLDPSQSSPSFSKHRCSLFILILVFLIIFIFFQLRDQPSGVYDPSSSSAKQKNVLSYENVIDEIRNEINYRNQIINELQKDFKELNLEFNIKQYYRKRPETQHVDCGRVLRGDKAYMEEVGGAQNRIKMVPNDKLDMSCSAISERVIPSTLGLKPLSFGVAFARIVYKDYEMIEDQVRASYHPQNVFCFAIDKKSDEKFHQRLKSLASCLPNIMLLPDEKSVDSSGHNVNIAHYNCMKALINKPGWQYVILLQNHDVITKSVYELNRVYELLDGANDVEITPEVGRVNKNFKWDPKSLKLFRNETGLDSSILNTPLTFAKGAAQGSLSRAAVDWMVRTADLTIYIDQLNNGFLGVDEIFIETLQVNSFLKMPGHFTDECLTREGINTDFISRMSQWISFEGCASKTTRHSLCLLGIEDLPTVAQFPSVMFNKMLPEYDVAIIDCTGELLFNRTFLNQQDHPLEESYYENMVNVQYHKHKNDPNYKLNCTPPYVKWSERKYPV